MRALVQLGSLLAIGGACEGESGEVVQTTAAITGPVGGAAPNASGAKETGGAAAAPAPEAKEPAWLTAALADPPALRLPVAQQLKSEDAGACPSKRERDRAVGVMTSPRVPAVGEPMRMWAADLSTTAALAMRVENAKGETQTLRVDSFDGVPARAVATWSPTTHGKYTLVVGREGKGLRCREFWVGKWPKKAVPPSPNAEHQWRTRGRWNAAEEALFSAWVAALFEGQPSEDLAWDSLHAITSDPSRNLLHNHQGWEDSSEFALELTPDCADLPYFLRAYYSWKRRLPFGFHRCSRGAKDKAPRCFSSWSVDEPPDLAPKWSSGEVPYTNREVMQRFFSRTLAWGVHTGNGRCALSDPDNDLYPVRLDRTSLRPGTIYADPYGHILVLTQFVPASNGRPGILYAVDGQPDASITRKRFWEGNFLWNSDAKLGGSGFKAFRPFEWEEVEVEVVDVLPEPGETGGETGGETSGETGAESSSETGAAADSEPANNGAQGGTHIEVRKQLRPLDNKAVQRKKGYGDLSSEQGAIDAIAFYDRMEVIISPQGRDPLLALRESVDALGEAARIRVTSVNNAEAYLKAHPGEVIEMPWGHSLFETTGAWENYSTPARDLRLLLSLDVVRSYEDKIKRAPAAFGLKAGEVAQAVERVGLLRSHLLKDPRYALSYTRSDGSVWTLSLAELVERASAFETAYNPNDCPEKRWGAPAGSDEASTCKRHAPPDQQKKVSAYKEWFERRQRPARGDPGPDVPGVERPPQED